MLDIISFLLCRQIIYHKLYVCKYLSYFLDGLGGRGITRHFIYFLFLFFVKLYHFTFLCQAGFSFRIKPIKWHFDFDCSNIPDLDVICDKFLLHIPYFLNSFWIFFKEILVIFVLFAIFRCIEGLHFFQDCVVFSFFKL